MNGLILQHIIRLSLAAILAFLAILLWGKTRDAAWMSIVAGVVLGFVGNVFDMLRDLGIVNLANTVHVWQIPLPSLVLMVLPFVFFIFAFALMLRRNK